MCWPVLTGHRAFLPACPVVNKISANFRCVNVLRAVCVSGTSHAYIHCEVHFDPPDQGTIMLVVLLLPPSLPCWVVSQKCQPEGGATGVSTMGVGVNKGVGDRLPDAREFERAPPAADSEERGRAETEKWAT
eukprot:686437-Prymnesium_polylepis.1